MHFAVRVCVSERLTSAKLFAPEILLGEQSVRIADCWHRIYHID